MGLLDDPIPVARVTVYRLRRRSHGRGKPCLFRAFGAVIYRPHFVAGVHIRVAGGSDQVPGAEGMRLPAWPGVFSWQLAHNTGAAFSLFGGSGVFLVAITALALAALAAVLLRSSAGRARRLSAPAALGLWLIVAGGLGNLYDRVVYGVVVDFIKLDFIRFAIFNVADIAICAGAALVALSLVRKEKAHDVDG
mgnify:CR=1 FL=1